MRDKSYVVQFIRKDNLPAEEYIYYDRDDAEKHLNLFEKDDSDLYLRIVLLAWFDNITTVLRTIEFI